MVAIAATEHGILYEGVFGSRRQSGGPAKEAAMTRDTVFRIASMVKLITSVAALRLVEQGKLSLDAPVPEIDPAVGAPQVLDGFDARGMPQSASAEAADFASASAHPHVRLHLSALGRRGDQICERHRQGAAGATKQAAAHAADVRSGRALAIRPQHRLGRPHRRSGRRRAARDAIPQAHFRAARHEGYRLRDRAGAARARSERASAPARRIAQARADGARAEAARGAAPPFRRRRHLFDRAGLSDAAAHAHARRGVRGRAHPASRNGRAHGPEPDRPGSKRAY